MELAALNSYPPTLTASNSTFAGVPTSPWNSDGHIIMGLRSEVQLADLNCQASCCVGMYHTVPKDPVADASSANSNALKSLFSRAVDDLDILDEPSSAQFLAHEISLRIFRFMMKPEVDIDIGLSLTQIGKDSLMAIELRRWWKQAFGLDIGRELWDRERWSSLGKLAAEALKGKFEGARYVGD